MQISYCDCCGCPVKGERYVFEIKKFYNNPPDPPEKYPEARFEKEICSSCYHNIMDIFRLKLHKMCELTAFIEKTYNIGVINEEKEINGNK